MRNKKKKIIIIKSHPLSFLLVSCFSGNPVQTSVHFCSLPVFQIKSWVEWAYLNMHQWPTCFMVSFTFSIFKEKLKNPQILYESFPWWWWPVEHLAFSLSCGRVQEHWNFKVFLGGSSVPWVGGEKAWSADDTAGRNSPCLGLFCFIAHQFTQKIIDISRM